MLSFRLKIAWCVLSSTGAICCTLFLWAFARVAGSRWGPVLYAAANIVLQGIFCLGMIYRMDPFAMPRSFCMAQSILITFATDVLTGVAIAFSMATYTAVLKPKTWSDGRRALQWRKAYLLPLVAFPAIATTVHIVLIVKLDALQPSDGMHCDATAPQWTRLFSSAGLPLLTTLPAIYLATSSILQIQKTNRHLQRAARPDSVVDEFKRSMSVSVSRNGSGAASRRVAFVPRGAGGAGVGGGGGGKGKEDNQTGIAKRFRLPFGRARSCSRSRSRTPHSVDAVGAGAGAGAGTGAGGKYEEYDDEEEEDDDEYKYIDEDEDEDASSRVSVTFPTFVNPHAVAPIPTPPPPPPPARTVPGADVQSAREVRGSWHHRRSGEEVVVVEHDARPRVSADVTVVPLRTTDSSTGCGTHTGTGSSSRGECTVEDGLEGESKADLDLDLGGDADMDMDVTDMDMDMDVYALGETAKGGGVGMESFSVSGHSSMPGRRQKKPPPSLAPAIRWLISFQILFIFVQLLASLSVFIDLVSHKPSPTPFGTHHVALLLAAWGPVFIFGPIAAVRKNLIPWRPLST